MSDLPWQKMRDVGLTDMLIEWMMCSRGLGGRRGQSVCLYRGLRGEAHIVWTSKLDNVRVLIGLRLSLLRNTMREIGSVVCCATRIR